MSSALNNAAKHADPAASIPTDSNMSTMQVPLVAFNPARGDETQPVTDAHIGDISYSAQTCPHAQAKRNLVVCIDGTANQFSVKNTNIVELYSNLIKSPDQLTYYNSGIGTYAKPAYMSLSYIVQRIDHTIDMMVAWNFKRIVLSAYQWLSENYEDGDRIFLFGFSRGAYQVRVIAGMIKLVGLLHKGNNDQIAFAFELYTSIIDVTDRTNKSMDKTSADLCQRFKETLCRQNVAVHFVGAWDTVSSIGVVRGRSLPETNTGMRHVCAFRHALALDERRVKFLPEYANGGMGPSETDNSDCDIKEVWFAGSHSDIGGGNTENMKLDKFGPALRWMIYEAIGHDLKINDQLRPSPASGLTPKQVVHADVATETSGQVAYLRARYTYKVLQDFSPISRFFVVFFKWIGHFVECLYMVAVYATIVALAGYQGIHRLLLEWVLLPPKPDTRDRPIEPPATTLWSTIDRPSKSLRGIWWFLEVIPFVSHLTYEDNDTTTTCQHLGQPRILQPGQRIHESVFQAMTPRPSSAASAPYFPLALHRDGSEWKDLIAEEDRIERDPYTSAGSLLLSLKGATQGIKSLSKGDVNVFLRLASSTVGLRSITESPNALDITVSTFLATPMSSADNVFRAMITVLSAFPPHLTTSRTYSHRKLNDVLNRYPTMGSATRTNILQHIRTWPFYGHTAQVNAVAISPDGSYLASASDDKSISVWDMKTGKIFGAPLIGHTSYVRSVAFSPDGGQIVSGAGDGTVRIWNVHTRQEAIPPLEGHTNWVQSVAFLLDGKKLVSGSSDGTVRVWDARTGDAVMKPLEGHTDRVLSVTFSLDGRLIASGSRDHSIRIWDAQTGEQCIPPLEGHSGSVRSVAFSPDGGHIVSGSYDNTIRIWDAKSGQLVMGPIRGHTRGVCSVAYSPNGSRIVSGSQDSTIRVWDVRSGEGVKELPVISGHKGRVFSVAVTPDGNQIVSGSRDETIRVWDMFTGAQLLGPVEGWSDLEETPSSDVICTEPSLI
ncbi:hypothetical protein HGRIS_013740 [Hohenbuehelia grisea]|uniref:T6SS Phospholipase effector Tle1-like catalytic domain-containing protein n=1 Tax=Hohenbuehelia grisea TaxID=104357 RepID=A0ABR3IWM6_9AGAR